MTLQPTPAMAIETPISKLIVAADDHQIRSTHPQKEDGDRSSNNNNKKKEVGKGDQSTEKSSSSVASDICTAADSGEAEESGRERLRRHRKEMGGRVWIPDTWGQQDSLKQWVHCNVFDVKNTNILSARAALIDATTSYK